MHVFCLSQLANKKDDEIVNPRQFYVLATYFWETKESQILLYATTTFPVVGEPRIELQTIVDGRYAYLSGMCSGGY